MPVREKGAWALVLAVYAWSVAQLWFVCDDAFISFRYARNAARGFGLRYNLGDHVPVEGYSNLLWTLMAAVVERIGADVELVMPWLSVLCGLALLAHVSSVVRALGGSERASWMAALMLAASPVFGTWSTGGLATMPAAWAMFATFDALIVRPAPRVGLAILAGACLILLRVEGMAWVAVMMVLAAYRRRDDRGALTQVALVTAVLVAVILAQMGWRWSVYGDWVANTARAKVGMSADRLLRGLKYIVGLWTELWIPALVMGGLPTLVRSGTVGRCIAAMAVAVPTWCVVVGGDYMAFGRLILTGLPFAVVGAALALDQWSTRQPRAWAGAIVLLAVGMLPTHDVPLSPRPVRDLLSVRSTTPWVHAEHEMLRSMRRNVKTWKKQGKALAAVAGPDVSLVTGAIGARGYHSDLFIYDRGGLVTQGVADSVSGIKASDRSPGHDVIADRGWFMKDKPTWIHFGDLTGKSVGRKQIAEEVKRFRPSKKIRNWYAPRVLPTEVDDVTHTIVVLERTETQEIAAQVWENWRRDYSLD